MKTTHTTFRGRRDEGAAALEFVLVVPFLISLVFAIVQFGLFFSNKVDVTSTARDAARTLALRGTPTYPVGMTPSAVQTCPAGNSTSNASVTLTATYDFSIPLIPLGTKAITATGTMRCGG